MRKFVEGDIVICVNNEGNRSLLTVGKSYCVTGDNGFSGGMVDIEIDGKEWQGFFSYRFEKNNRELL
jgi:hypothetical protein